MSNQCSPLPSWKHTETNKEEKENSAILNPQDLTLNVMESHFTPEEMGSQVGMVTCWESHRQMLKAS